MIDTFLSQALAHAFYPKYGGNVHMNEERRWTAGPYLLEVSLLFQLQTSLFFAIFAHSGEWGLTFPPGFYP